MRVWFLLLIGLIPASGREKWVYLPANFQVDSEVERVTALLHRARAAGYDHGLVADSKFARIGTLPNRYFENIERIKQTATSLKFELVPAVFPVGYSNDLLFHNPNLAEGLPVKNALFIVHDGIAKLQQDPAVSLPGGNMDERKKWRFVDDNILIEEGAMHSPPTATNARIHELLRVSPFRQYHISVRIRSRDLRGSLPEIKALTPSGKSLQWTHLGVKSDQDWTTHHVTFNSLDHTEIGLYFGVWGGHRGDLWWDDATIEECGLVNLLRRPGAPLTIRSEDRNLLREHTDYDTPVDPLLGTKPWPGEYTAWHTPPDIITHGLADGTRLRVSFYHPHIIYDGQVCGCVEEIEFQKLLEDQANRIAKLWGATSHLMSHDEWRVLGSDESCQKSGLNPGQIAAKNLRFCTQLLRRVAPGSKLIVWSDMFDPYHNAIADYYLVHGSLTESWNGLDPSVTVMNWNFDHRDQSLKFFANHGNHQIIAGYYDEPIENVTHWLESAHNTPHVDGFMYTTWRGDYSKLEEVSHILQLNGF